MKRYFLMMMLCQILFMNCDGQIRNKVDTRLSALHSLRLFAALRYSVDAMPISTIEQFVNELNASPEGYEHDLHSYIPECGLHIYVLRIADVSQVFANRENQHQYIFACVYEQDLQNKEFEVCFGALNGRIKTEKQLKGFFSRQYNGCDWVQIELDGT